MAPHSSTFAWKIPWMEGPGRLQSMGSLGVGYDWATSLSLFTFMHWRRKWQPTPVFLPGESQGRGDWWAAIYGVAQSWIRLKQLSSIYGESRTWGMGCLTALALEEWIVSDILILGLAYIPWICSGKEFVSISLGKCGLFMRESWMWCLWSCW